MRYLFDEVNNIKLLGRHSSNASANHSYPLFFTGSGIELNVTGSSLYVEFESTFDTFENYICIYINDALIQKRMIDNMAEKICIFRGVNSDSIKNVKILKCTQPFKNDANNYLAITAFETDGEFMPVEEKDIKIEFVGDSITSGEGLRGSKEDTDWLPMYLDIDGNYAKLTADMLEADFNIISQSGWGIYSSWDNIKENTLSKIYEYVCLPLKNDKNVANGSQEKYDFSTFVADYVIVNLGTNDAIALEENFSEERLNAITKAVYDLLVMIRKNQPFAMIIWAYGAFDDSLKPFISDGISRYSKDYNDKNVSYVALPELTEDNVGSRNHPGRALHEEIANTISNHIINKRILNFN